MNRFGIIFCLLVIMQWAWVPFSVAGPYPPEADAVGSHAVSMDAPALIAWATGYDDYSVGADVDMIWQDPQKALGKAEGTSFDIVALGRGGSITLTFDSPIENGEGWDFAVFENSFSDLYLELAYVEVSSNGIDFVRFDAASLTPSPVPGFGNLDPTDVDGLAGKYRQGFGTPFDLEDLAEKSEVISGLVDLSSVSFVRLVDVVGDGSSLDSTGAPIYDPYPTAASAGFDLDAIGVSNGASYPAGEYTPPEVPLDDDDAGFSGGAGCFLETR